MRVHVPLHVASYSEWLSTDSALVRFLTGVYTTMVLQITARPERFVAVLAAVILFASVDSPVNDQRILPRKVLAAVLALILFLLRVDASRVVFQIPALTEVTAAFLALVRLVTAMEALVNLHLEKIYSEISFGRLGNSSFFYEPLSFADEMKTLETDGKYY